MPELNPVPDNQGFMLFEHWETSGTEPTLLSIADIPSDMVGTICTLVILCVGLQILWGVCIPFTPLHWAIWGSMTVAGVGGAFLLARWLPLVRLDLGGTLVLVVLLALSAPTLAGLVFMGERLHGMVNDWKNKKARKHV